MLHSSDSGERLLSKASNINADEKNRQEVEAIFKKYPFRGQNAAVFEIVDLVAHEKYDPDNDEKINDFVKQYEQATRLLQQLTVKNDSDYESLGGVFDDLSAVYFALGATSESRKLADIALKNFKKVGNVSRINLQQNVISVRFNEEKEVYSQASSMFSLAIKSAQGSVVAKPTTTSTQAELFVGNKENRSKENELKATTPEYKHVAS